MTKLTALRRLIRDRMSLLEFSEYRDEFTEEVPLTIADKSFHLKTTTSDVKSLNQNDLTLDVEHELTIWRRGFNDTSEATDTILSEVETILLDLLAPAQRLNEEYGFLSVSVKGFAIESLNGENENVVKAKINLSAKVSIGL